MGLHPEERAAGLNEGVDRLWFKRLAKNLYSNGFDGIEVRRVPRPAHNSESVKHLYS